MALRNHSRISLKLRTQIQEKAVEMGYRPDPMLSALANYRRTRSDQLPTHSAIAWINTWPQPKELRMLQEFDAYWNGAARCAERFGYRLEEFIINKQLSPRRLEKILLTRNIRGILLPPQRTPSQWEGFDWARFAAVRFGQTIQSPKVNSVESDQSGNVVLAVQNMRGKGYERIGFVGGKTHRTAYIGGYAIAHQDVPISKQVPPLFLSHESPSRDRKDLSTWMKSHRPEAILTEEGDLQEVLATAGFRVPQDVALAGLSLLDVKASAGINQNPEEIGRVAVLLAISLIQENAYGVPLIARKILIEGKWVNGCSLPDRSGL